MSGVGWSIEFGAPWLPAETSEGGVREVCCWRRRRSPGARYLSHHDIHAGGDDERREGVLADMKSSGCADAHFLAAVRNRKETHRIAAAPGE